MFVWRVRGSVSDCVAREMNGHMNAERPGWQTDSQSIEVIRGSECTRDRMHEPHARSTMTMSVCVLPRPAAHSHRPAPPPSSIQQRTGSDITGPSVHRIDAPLHNESNQCLCAVGACVLHQPASQPPIPHPMPSHSAASSPHRACQTIQPVRQSVTHSLTRSLSQSVSQSIKSGGWSRLYERRNHSVTQWKQASKETN